MLFFPFFCAQAAAPSKVYMVLWDGCEDACRGFLDYLKSARANVEIIQRNLNKKTDKIPALTAEIKEISPDLLVTWGTLATLEMLGTENNGPVSKYGAVPALFMVVSQPVESGLVSSLVSQGRNITGVMHLVPLSEQLQYARQIVAFKRLGIVYNPAETNAQIAVDQLKRYASMMNFELLERPVPLDKNDRPDVRAVAGLVAELAESKADLIYFKGVPFDNSILAALRRTRNCKHISMFDA